MHADLEFPLPPNERDFLDAAIAGDVSRLRDLHAKGVPVDVLDNRDLPWGQTALMHAALHGHLDAVRFLLSVGAKVSTKDRGGDEVEQNRQPLHYAMRSKNIAVAEALLDAHAGPNTVSHYGDTPLKIAIEEGNIEGVRLLLRRGAEINLKPRTKRYTPPLCAAALHGRPVILRLLLEAGADVNATDSYGQTALMCASYSSDQVAVLIIGDLLRANAKVDYDAAGRTALFMAVIHGHLRATRALLEGGTGVNFIYESQQGTLLDAIERRIQSHRKESAEKLSEVPGYSMDRLLLWDDMFNLLREFSAKRMSEL